uniref:PGN_0703 family putative restriction endonuclease n=1 Tax=Pseudarthrobacter oxydans TaxID=1671 RepID=UPI003F4958B1
MSHSDPLERLGPQLPGETGLAKRLRFHQSWYRSEVLGVSGFGSTPAPAARPLGSILPIALAASGRNFTTRTAEHLYEQRRAQGWGVDPVRCTRYLTSSQTLTLNVLAPLFAEPQWLVKVLSSALDRSDILAIDYAAVEHAPSQRSQFLGDMTRMDGFIILRCRTRYEAVVLEFKYADRFNSRNVQIVDRTTYQDLAARTAIWADFRDVAKDRSFNQLVRCHALGAATLEHSTGSMRTTLLVIHHEMDARAAHIVAGYQAKVADPTTAAGLTLAQLCDHMANTATAEQREIVATLRSRYANETGSDEWWELLTDS